LKKTKATNKSFWWVFFFLFFYLSVFSNNFKKIISFLCCSQYTRRRDEEAERQSAIQFDAARWDAAGVSHCGVFASVWAARRADGDMAAEAASHMKGRLLSKYDKNDDDDGWWLGCWGWAAL